MKNGTIHKKAGYVIYRPPFLQLVSRSAHLVDGQIPTQITSPCIKGPLCQDRAFNTRGRLHHRKQHFLQHFDKVHPHVPCEYYLMGSHFVVDSKFPRNCGFCHHHFVYWRDRVDHIGAHFHDEGKDMLEWSDTSEEEDHEDGDHTNHDRDDEDKDKDDASDSSDDDDSNYPPARPAPRSCKSRSALARAKSGNRMTQPASQMLQMRSSIFDGICEIKAHTLYRKLGHFERPFNPRTGHPRSFRRRQTVPDSREFLNPRLLYNEANIFRPFPTANGLNTLLLSRYILIPE
jgi:hypothetical protein